LTTSSAALSSETAEQLTQRDIAHLNQGNNNLLDLAAAWATLNKAAFLHEVMLD
jgi:hypothetical protein